MFEPKTKVTEVRVTDFIETIENEKKRADAYQLLEIFKEETGMEPVMWGPSIIGFGKYHYKYATGHEGDAAIVGFSPRKAKISLYLMYDSEERTQLLEKFGKHTTGVACTYINKLADIDTDVLRTMIRRTMEIVREMYPEE